MTRIVTSWLWTGSVSDDVPCLLSMSRDHGTTSSGSYLESGNCTHQLHACPRSQYQFKRLVYTYDLIVFVGESRHRRPKANDTSPSATGLLISWPIACRLSPMCRFRPSQVVACIVLDGGRSQPGHQTPPPPPRSCVGG